MPQDTSIRDLSNFLLDFAVLLLGAGAQTSRVLRNVTRIAQSFGYDVELTSLPKHVIMSVISLDDDRIRRTEVREITQRSINFETISGLNALSWSAHDEHMPLEELQRRYLEVIARPRVSRWVVLIATSVANAAFCRLFGGDLIAMGLVLIATLVGFYVRQELAGRGLDHNIVFVVSAFIASLIASADFYWKLGSTPEIALGASVLFLIPGVPLINCIADMLDGHILMGISRAVKAAMLIASIAIGLSATLLLAGVNTL